jgi:hypothetical protein
METSDISLPEEGSSNGGVTPGSESGRPHRQRRRRDGRWVRVKNLASADNGRPKAVHVTHGGKSAALLSGKLDLRSSVGRSYRQHVEALAAHLGGDPTAPEARLIDQASRLRLLALLAWSEIERGGAFRDGAPVPAVDAFRRAAADERDVLRLLGLQSRGKPVQSIDDYLAGHGQPGSPE